MVNLYRQIGTEDGAERLEHVQEKSVQISERHSVHLNMNLEAIGCKQEIKGVTYKRNGTRSSQSSGGLTSVASLTGTLILLVPRFGHSSKSLKSAPPFSTRRAAFTIRSAACCHLPCSSVCRYVRIEFLDHSQTVLLRHGKKPVRMDQCDGAVYSALAPILTTAVLLQFLNLNNVSALFENRFTFG